MTAGTRLAARQDVQAYAFLAPAFVLLAALLVYPLAHVIRLSFYEGTAARILGRPRQLFGPAQIRLSGRRLADGPLHLRQRGAHLVIGLGLALLLHARIAPTPHLIRGLLIVPWLLAPVVAGMIWVLVPAPFGVLNGLLSTLGLIDANATISWLGDPRTALLSVTL